MRWRAATLLKRFWLRALCYIFGGAIVGVPVSWLVANRPTSGQDYHDAMAVLERDGLSLLVQTSRECGSGYVSFTPYVDQETAERSASIVRDMGQRRRITYEVADSVPAWALVVLDDYASELPPAKNTTTSNVAVSAIGWPCLCVKAVIVRVGRAPVPPAKGLIRVGTSVALPWLPIWRGLLINALFYAPVPMGLHWTWRAWVRHLRTTSGQCPACGYDRKGLATDAPCPECGTIPK